MEKLILAIDLGGGSAKCAVTNNRGNKITEYDVPINRLGSCIEIFQTIKQATDQKLLNKGYSGNDISIVCAALPGSYNYKNNILETAPNIPALTKLNITETLNKELWPKQQIICLNDADAAAFGQYSRNEAETNIMLYTIGTGVGGGTITNKQLVFDKSGISTSEFGHISDSYGPYGQEKCGCNQSGCLETVASASAMNKAINKYYQDYPNNDFAMFINSLKVKDSLTTEHYNKFLTNSSERENSDIKAILNPAFAYLASDIAQRSLDNPEHKFYITGGGAQVTGFLPSLLENINNPQLREKISISENPSKLGLEGVISFALAKINENKNVEQAKHEPALNLS